MHKMIALLLTTAALALPGAAAAATTDQAPDQAPVSVERSSWG